MCHSLINTYAATGGRLAGLATFKSLTRLCLSCRWTKEDLRILVSGERCNVTGEYFERGYV